MESDVKVLRTAIALGLLAGIRTMSPAALMTRTGAENGRANDDSLFASERVRLILNSFAIAELVADKLPFMPNRTGSIALLGRMCSAGIAGATIGHREGKEPLPPALAGISAALFSAYLSFNTRRFLTKKVHIPDFIVAMGEDLTVALLGWWLLYGRERERYIVREI